MRENLPLTFTRNFRVRYYECDANGHLYSTNYLRYMQETAFDASAAAGYDMERYDAIQRHWLIRESEVEFLRPVRYDQKVAVSTWIADFRRVTSLRAYEFRQVETGELAARAATDWVFLDAQSKRPTGIPAALVEAFYPQGVPDRFPPRRPFPASPPPPPEVFRMRRQVRWQDIDAMQHVNNAAYLDYFNECALQVCNAYGWQWQRMAEEGFGIYLRQARLQYLQPAVLGDELEVSTWVSRVQPASSARHFTLQRCSDGALLTQAYLVSAWVDTQTGLPMRIPPHMLADFSPNIAGNA